MIKKTVKKKRLFHTIEIIYIQINKQKTTFTNK